MTIIFRYMRIFIGNNREISLDKKHPFDIRYLNF